MLDHKWKKPGDPITDTDPIRGGDGQNCVKAPKN